MGLWGVCDPGQAMSDRPCLMITHRAIGAGDSAGTPCGLSAFRFTANDRARVSGDIDCPRCIEAEAEGLGPSLDHRAARIAFLERKRVATKADLLMKFEDDDWHGVQDCGSDLRDIDSELKGLRA